jgi:hypothetical protein
MKPQQLAGMVIASAALFASACAAHGAEEAPFVAAVANEPPARLFVEPPLPGALARGAALIPYRVENLRIVPVLGADARKLSPRVGHLHITVDDLPWRWGDFSGANTVVVTGLPAGPHKILIELSDPEHRILAAQTVTFTVPAAASHSH